MVYAIILQHRELRLQYEQLKLAHHELQLLATNQGHAAASLGNQLREMQADRKNLAILDIFNYLNSEPAIAVRKKIFSLEQNAVITDDALRAEAEGLLSRLNLTAYLISRGLVYKDECIEVLYITVLRIWYKLQHHIVKTREQRGIYLHHFQWLVQQSIDYWTQEHSEHPIQLINSANGKIESLNRRYLQSSLDELRKITAPYVTAKDASA